MRRIFIKYHERLAACARGYSLLEALVSLLILAIVIVSGSAFFTYAREIQALAAHKRMARELINSKLEALKNAAYADLPDPSVPDITNVTVGHLPGQQTTTVTDLTGAFGTPEGYKSVTTKIAWNQPMQGGKNLEMDFTTIIAP